MLKISVKMPENFNHIPFDRIHRILTRTEDKEPLVNKIGVKRVDRKNRRHETIHESINYIEQARKLLKGAEVHDSEHAYKFAEESIDDLQQNLQMLETPYPEQVDKIRDLIPALWKEKRPINNNLTEDPEGIADREYNQVLLDLLTDDLTEMKNDKSISFEDTPEYRPTYWSD